MDGLGKDPDRAAQRAAQLVAVDADRRRPWPLDRQRHHAVLRDLAVDEPEGRLPELQPGVMVEGDDLGRWIARQRRDWAQLSATQQERLAKPGIEPVKRPTPAPAAKSGGKTSAAFTRGLTALAQWVEREGAGRPVPHGHVEETVIDGETEPIAAKLSVWISNSRARRDKLTDPQRATLAEQGMDWA
ncbi:helicase associated domain-containing protein [Streptomyces fildesensis]|uniref:Helicase associated domain-containing protein n=1 Tax=Streptomyces fildesensis TaxID=375757 RepID=A0ABW8CJC0_9ACTN